jgi:hypothetical protein
MVRNKGDQLYEALSTASTLFAKDLSTSMVGSPSPAINVDLEG